MSERGSSVGRYEPIPTIPEEPLPMPALNPPPLPPPNPTTEPRLEHVDFWPECTNSSAAFALLQFERFDTLLPRANSWLRKNQQVSLLKCETIERKIWNLDQAQADHREPSFDVPSNIDVVFYLKGLRLWYDPGYANKRCRIHPCQVGYRNSLPRCQDASLKYPVYEELGPMYTSLNEDLIERPLEGPIVTMETVTVRLDRLHWEGPDVEVDRSHWPMAPKQHVFFFTRIFYLFECPAYEQVGAADFLPDMMNEPSNKVGLPKYTGLPFVMKKFNAWLKQVKDIRITNIQSLEAAFAGRTEKVKTNTNFITKADTMTMIRFVRVTYTRPKFGLPPGGLPIPRAISQKTFVPNVTKTTDNQSPELETLINMSNRIRAWFKHVGNRILSVEVLYHPLPLIVNKADNGETTVLPGEWQPLLVETSNKKQSMQPAAQLCLFRLYLEGEFQEPSQLMLQQSLPSNEEVKDCCSLL